MARSQRLRDLEGLGDRRPILSRAVMDPKALTELIPDWKERGRR